MALTENEIIDIVYSLYETDTEGWDTTSSEYLSARNYCNAAIARWEGYMNTTWNELWTKLEDAADGDDTITAGTYAYDCPTNFKRPGSWVRTGDTPQFWTVIQPPKSGSYDGTAEYVCWFTGNAKDGFDLNFNPEVTLTTGDTIAYEYYKTATQFTATTSTTEMSDPYFIVYYVLYRFLKNDGEDFTDDANMSEDLLDNMRTANMTGLFGIHDPVDTMSEGFGV